MCSAKTESEQYKAYAAENVSEYHLAIRDEAFLLRPEVRPLRVQMELLRPELVLQDHQINEGMIIFGSARIPDSDIAESAVLEAKKAFQADPSDARLQQILNK